MGMQLATNDLVLFARELTLPACVTFLRLRKISAIVTFCVVSLFTPIHAPYAQVVVPFYPDADQGPSGGIGGSDFRLLSKAHPSSMAEKYKVHQVDVFVGNYIEGLYVTFRNRLTGEQLSQAAGGRNGTRYIFGPLDDDEYIDMVYGRYGHYVDSLTLETNKGRKATYGGRGGSVSFRYVASRDEEVSGFYGRAGTLIDALGVTIRMQRIHCEGANFLPAYPRKVYDCSNQCVDEGRALQWVGDGYCDNGSYGLDLLCYEFDYDGGDCG